MKLAVVDGCPCPRSIAPYVALVLREAGQTASSIYRGEDAKALLHRLGKHTQGEIHQLYPSISNPPHHSEHELWSDDGLHRLAEWQVGVDSGGNDAASKRWVLNAAARLGWKIHHPYPRGVEGHHWQFLEQPKPRNLKQRVQIAHLRVKLAVGR